MTEATRATAAALLVAAIAVLLAAIDPSFFVKDDFQLEFLPASKEIARAWTGGEFPLLSRSSWMCAGLAAEYQFGVFSIFRMLLEGLSWLLPLSLAARGTMLFIVHAAIAAAGGFLLARSYGARPASALMVALVAGLNGWMLWWGTTWYAIAASFAWLPWYWLALRGIAAGRRWAWIGAAFAIYLVVTGGAPYVVAMAALVAAINVFGRRRNALTMIGASALGLALSAPAVLMLLEYFPATARSNAATAFETLWIVPVRALLGFIVPAFTTRWEVFGGATPRAAVEMLGAFVPLAAIAAWLVFRKGRRLADQRLTAEIVLLLVLLVLMLLPSAGPFRWSFRWLPLFHLVLALIGAVALEHVRRAWIAGLALLAIAVVVALGDPPTLAHAAIVAVLCLAWMRFGEAMPPVITIAMIVMTFVSFSHRDEVPVWQTGPHLETPAPLDPSRRYLAMYDLDAVIAPDAQGRYTRGTSPELRPGNLPMLSGLDFVNGYSPMLGPLRDLFDFDVHGPMPADRAEQILRYETGRHQLLHHIGVDGLLVPGALARRHAVVLSGNGWKPVAAIADCLVLHRDERLAEPLFEAALAIKTPNEQEAYAAIAGRRTPQLPVILLTPGGRERYGRRAIATIVEARHSTSFVVRGRGPKALIVFRRPWLPGWRATIGDRPLPVLRANLSMPAVEIPSKAEGEVRLVYRPRSLVLGAVLAAMALLVTATLSLRLRRSQ